MQFSLGSLYDSRTPGLLSRLAGSNGVPFNGATLASLGMPSASLADLGAAADASPRSVQPLAEPAFAPQPPMMQRNPSAPPLPTASALQPGAPQSLGAMSPPPQSLGDMSPPQGGASVNLDTRPAANLSGIPSLADMANGLPTAGTLHKPTDWGKILGGVLGTIGDGLSVYGGKQPLFGPAMARENEMRLQEDYENQRLSQELAERREVALRPRTEQAGNTIGTFDPTNSSFTPVYTAPSAAEQYAAALGYQPGSDDYKQAVKDYRLGAYSDPALANRMALDDERFGNRRTLQGDRLAVTERGQNLSHTDRQATIHQSNTNNLRSTGASTANNVRSTQTSAANNVRSTSTSAADAQLSSQTRLQTARRVRPIGNEPVAVDPHGNKLVVRNGQWVPAH